MCTCASCSYTDGFSGRADLFSDGSPTIKGFDKWPRGKPAGVRASETAYRAHVAHLWDGVKRHAEPFKPGQAPRFNIPGLVPPVQPMPQWWYDWNRKTAAALATAARPTQPGKAEPHLHGEDRPAAPSATIYEMAKEKAKRPVGRPALPGGIKRVLVSLDQATIERGKKLGGDNLSAGIRKALAKVR